MTKEEEMKQAKVDFGESPFPSLVSPFIRPSDRRAMREEERKDNSLKLRALAGLGECENMSQSPQSASDDVILLVQCVAF